MHQDPAETISKKWDAPFWACLAALFVLYAACGMTGYGTDNDIYEMMRAGTEFFRDGRYWPSRSPGYPLPEMVVSAAAQAGGYVFSNAISVLLGCLALACFYRLLRDAFGRRNALLSMVAVGVNPYWIIAASSSMDYVYAAAFFLLGAVLLQKGRLMWAACAFAAATASRVTYLPLAGIAYAVALAWSQIPALFAPRSGIPTPRRLAVSLGVFLALSVAVYGAVYAAAGAAMFRVYTGKPIGFFSFEGYDTLREYLGRFIYKNIFLWGLPAFFVLAIAVIVALRRRLSFRRSPSTQSAQPAQSSARNKPFGAKGVTWGVWAAVAYCLVLFFRLPLEISYQLPVLFLGLYLLNTIPWARLFVPCVIAGHILHALAAPDLFQIDYLPPSLDGKTALGARFHPNLRTGILVEDLRNRRVNEAYYIRKFHLEKLPGRGD
jgi:hypothetical protein